MPARKKDLLEFVRDGTFLARRHAYLLEEEPLPRRANPELRRLQMAYCAEGSEAERRSLSLQFERAVHERASSRARQAEDELAAELAKLGRPGSAEQVINFFPRFLRWDDGKRFRADVYQQEFIREAYRRDRRGRRIYKEILLGIPRGNGKTPLASGLALHALLASPGRPRVFQAAGAKDQAAIGLEYAHAWLETGDLGGWLRPRARGVTRRDGLGSYSVISAGGGLGHGRKPTIAIVDEWWAFTTYAQTQTFTAMETALHKLPDAYLLAISTAGHDKETQLGQAYLTAFDLPDVRTYRDGFLTVARDVEAGRLMWWYGLPDGYDLDLEDDAAVLRAIQLANPGSWVDHRELLRALRRTRDVLEWYRLVLNSWTNVAGVWLPSGVWRGLAEPELQIPDGADIWVGVDAAHTIDATAVAWAWRAPDGRIVLRVKVWSLRDDAPAHVHVSDDSLDNEELVEPFIHELAQRYRIRQVVADPNYFGTELRHLSKRYPTAPIYPSSLEMREWVQAFYRGCLDGKVAHLGNEDRVFTAHVENIAGKKNANGYWLIKKLEQTAPMDAGTAAIIAFGQALAAESDGKLNIYFLDDLDEDEPDDE